MMAGLRFALVVLLGPKRLLPFSGLIGLTRGFTSAGTALQNHRYRQADDLLKVFAASDDGKRDDSVTVDGIWPPLFDNPRRAVGFSVLMACSGAVLGPFLDSFHSAFGVLQYDVPITVQLWGRDADHPALITAWWVPALFGLAGFLIGWLYILLGRVLDKDESDYPPSPPKILIGISLFTFQYWLSGALYQSGVDRNVILNVMSVVAAAGFWALDGSMTGLLISTMTALGGPAIEVGLLTVASLPTFDFAGYHYTDLGETGYFPLWIIPVYFLGGPANGNLAKGIWYMLKPTAATETTTTDRPRGTMMVPVCTQCKDTRCVPCPNWSVSRGMKVTHQFTNKELLYTVQIPVMALALTLRWEAQP
jgi:hypothetical protein